jgi:hypothetical protein
MSITNIAGLGLVYIATAIVAWKTHDFFYVTIFRRIHESEGERLAAKIGGSLIIWPAITLFVADLLWFDASIVRPLFLDKSSSVVSDKNSSETKPESNAASKSDVKSEPKTEPHSKQDVGTEAYNEEKKLNEPESVEKKE